MTEEFLLLIRLLLQTTAYVIYSSITQSAKHITPNQAKHWSIRFCFKYTHNSEQAFLQYLASSDVKGLQKRDHYCFHTGKLRHERIQLTSCDAVGLKAHLQASAGSSAYYVLLPPYASVDFSVIIWPGCSGATCQKHMLMMKIVGGA